MVGVAALSICLVIMAMPILRNEFYAWLVMLIIINAAVLALDIDFILLISWLLSITKLFLCHRRVALSNSQYEQYIRVKVGLENG
jgi:hypothetical protein